VKRHAIFLFVSYISVCFNLSGCGNGENALPGERPISTIVGSTPIVNGEITVSDFSDHSTVLATSESNGAGQFEIELQVSPRPIEICIKNGAYYEIASDLQVPTGDRELCSVINYANVDSINLQINYYTHLAAGLAHYGASRLPISRSIDNANNRVSKVVGFDIQNVEPIVINRASSQTAYATNAHLYGFANAALSFLSKQISVHLGSAPHVNYESMYLADLAYQDILTDGILNGIGRLGHLSLGGSTIDTSLYRHQLAKHIFTAVNDVSVNLTSLRGKDVLFLATTMNDSNDPMFDNFPITKLSLDGTAVDNLTPKENDHVSGVFTISGNVYDILGVSSIEVLVKGISLGYATDLSTISFSVDSSKFADGYHDFTIRIVNEIGTVTEFPARINVDNQHFMYTWVRNKTDAGHWPGGILPYCTIWSDFYIMNTDKGIATHSAVTDGLYPLIEHPSGKYMYFYHVLNNDIMSYQVAPITGQIFNGQVLVDLQYYRSDNNSGLVNNFDIEPDIGDVFQYTNDKRHLLYLSDYARIITNVFGNEMSYYNGYFTPPYRWFGPPSFIASYRFEDDGGLTEVNRVNIHDGTGTFAVHPTLPYFYVPFRYDGVIRTYSIDTSLGVINEDTSKPMIQANGVETIAIDNNGKYAYVGSRLDINGSSLQKYKINADGSLVLVEYMPTCCDVRSIVFHGNGKFLYVATYDGVIHIYDISGDTASLVFETAPVLQGIMLSAGLEGIELGADSNYAVFWGRMGISTASINNDTGEFGVINPLVVGNPSYVGRGWTVAKPVIIRGPENQ